MEMKRKSLSRCSSSHPNASCVSQHTRSGKVQSSKQRRRRNGCCLITHGQQRSEVFWEDPLRRNRPQKGRELYDKQRVNITSCFQFSRCDLSNSLRQYSIHGHSTRCTSTDYLWRRKKITRQSDLCQGQKTLQRTNGKGQWRSARHETQQSRGRSASTALGCQHPQCGYPALKASVRQSIHKACEKWSAESRLATNPKLTYHS